MVKRKQTFCRIEGWALQHITGTHCKDRLKDMTDMRQKSVQSWVLCTTYRRCYHVTAGPVVRAGLYPINFLSLTELTGEKGCLVLGNTP
jgi:hypothetical protein